MALISLAYTISTTCDSGIKITRNIAVLKIAQNKKGDG
jgi:hypothetical protein